MATSEDAPSIENPSARDLLLHADARQVFNVGGDSSGITLHKDDVEDGDTVFLLDTDDPNVKKLYYPGYLD